MVTTESGASYRGSTFVAVDNASEAAQDSKKKKRKRKLSKDVQKVTRFLKEKGYTLSVKPRTTSEIERIEAIGEVSEMVQKQASEKRDKATGETSNEERRRSNLRYGYWYTDADIGPLLTHHVEQLGEAHKMVIDYVANPLTVLMDPVRSAAILDADGEQILIPAPEAELNIVDQTVAQNSDGHPIISLRESVLEEVRVNIVDSMDNIPSVRDTAREYILPVNTGRREGGGIHWVGARIKVGAGNPSASVSIKYMDSMFPDIADYAADEDCPGELEPLRTKLSAQEKKVNNIRADATAEVIAEFQKLKAVSKLYELRVQVADALGVDTQNISFESNLRVKKQPDIVTQRDSSLCGAATIANLIDVMSPGADIAGSSRADFLQLQRESPIDAAMQLRRAHANVLWPISNEGMQTVTHLRQDLEEFLHNSTFAKNYVGSVENLDVVRARLCDIAIDDRMNGKRLDQREIFRDIRELVKGMDGASIANAHSRQIYGMYEKEEAYINAVLDRTSSQLKPKAHYVGTGVHTTFFSGEGFRINKFYRSSILEEMGAEQDDYITHVKLADGSWKDIRNLEHEEALTLSRFADGRDVVFRVERDGEVIDIGEGQNKKASVQIPKYGKMYSFKERQENVKNEWYKEAEKIASNEALSDRIRGVARHAATIRDNRDDGRKGGESVNKYEDIDQDGVINIKILRKYIKQKLLNKVHGQDISYDNIDQLPFGVAPLRRAPASPEVVDLAGSQSSSPSSSDSEPDLDASLAQRPGFIRRWVAKFWSVMSPKDSTDMNQTSALPEVVELASSRSSSPSSSDSESDLDIRPVRRLGSVRRRAANSSFVGSIETSKDSNLLDASVYGSPGLGILMHPDDARRFLDESSDSDLSGVNRRLDMDSSLGDEADHSDMGMPDMDGYGSSGDNGPGFDSPLVTPPQRPRRPSDRVGEASHSPRVRRSARLRGEEPNQTIVLLTEFITDGNMPNSLKGILPSKSKDMGWRGHVQKELRKREQACDKSHAIGHAPKKQYFPHASKKKGGEGFSR